SSFSGLGTAQRRAPAVGGVEVLGNQGPPSCAHFPRQKGRSLPPVTRTMSWSITHAVQPGGSWLLTAPLIFSTPPYSMSNLGAGSRDGTFHPNQRRTTTGTDVLKREEICKRLRGPRAQRTCPSESQRICRR